MSNKEQFLAELIDAQKGDPVPVELAVYRKSLDKDRVERIALTLLHGYHARGLIRLGPNVISTAIDNAEIIAAALDDRGYSPSLGDRLRAELPENFQQVLSLVAQKFLESVQAEGATVPGAAEQPPS